MKNNYKHTSEILLSSTLQSYAQIFFSNSAWFGIVLMIVSFFDVWAGLAGLFSVVATNVAAYLIGLNTFNIKNGYYGFNTLLVGLGIGMQFTPSLEMYLLVFFASLLTLLLTVVSEGVVGKYGLPYLSISFLISIWVITLASRQYEHLEISQRGLFMYNEMYDAGGLTMAKWYWWFVNLGLPESVVTYFRSLGAIFFQYNLFAGVIIAIGLLFYSRIAFISTLLGFFSAYWFYEFIGGDLAQLNSSYVGFNFILTAIALGGFFLVSSKHSFLWILLSVPIISILIAASTVIFSVYGLSIYSLPFNIVVLSVLYVFKFRERNFDKPQIVIHQTFSPELNLYAQLNHTERFSKLYYVQFELPILGEWKITQAHNGKLTHRGNWQHAWDFELEDSEGKLFARNGFSKEDYYSYSKPIISPADGWVIQIIDSIEDNEIGNVDLEHNWGNTIIIKHAEGLFSNISHILKDSFKVKIGDYVKKGDPIALCGNSGRSPQPHVHFQIQALPFVGSNTIKYPLAFFVHREENQFNLNFFDYPTLNQNVSNIEVSPNLKEAFNFIPGQQIYFSIKNRKTNVSKEVSFEILVDYYNNPYFYCHETKSSAFFRNDGKIFMFTTYYGPKKGLLYHFYMAFYRIPLGFYKGVEIKDSFPINFLNVKPLVILQDIIAPFYIFLKSEYTALFLKNNEDFSKTETFIETQSCMKIGSAKMKSIKYSILIKNSNIESLLIESKNTIMEAKQIFKKRELEN